MLFPVFEESIEKSEEKVQADRGYEYKKYDEYILIPGTNNVFIIIIHIVADILSQLCEGIPPDIDINYSQ